jgi:hypothetical protein
MLVSKDQIPSNFSPEIGKWLVVPLHPSTTHAHSKESNPVVRETEASLFEQQRDPCHKTTAQVAGVDVAHDVVIVLDNSQFSLFLKTFLPEVREWR